MVITHLHLIYGKKKISEIYDMNMIGFIKRLLIKVIGIKKVKEIWDQVVSWEFKWLEVAIAHDKDRDGEKNGCAGANSSGDEQQGDQLGIGARGARVGMSLISKEEVSGTEHKIE